MWLKIRCELVSKFCIFVVWNSNYTYIFIFGWLWIGFKILYLCGLKQFKPKAKAEVKRCELVSKFCIFVVWNSLIKWNKKQITLWIGFKILYLCGLKQYYKYIGVVESVVNWFQNFVSLWSKQLMINVEQLKFCCELVSKFCIFVVWNSLSDLGLTFNLLWIGFKFCIFVVWNSFNIDFQRLMGCELVSNFVSLWSETVFNSNGEAFIRCELVSNFVSLWSETVVFWWGIFAICCELVSKFCIFVVWNSNITTWNTLHMLWIGFKILYLCGLKQFYQKQKPCFAVVNWFQNFVSLWSETVKTYDIIAVYSLWIGFKILYLCGLKQFKYPITA